MEVTMIAFCIYVGYVSPRTEKFHLSVYRTATRLLGKIEQRSKIVMFCRDTPDGLRCCNDPVSFAEICFIPSDCESVDDAIKDYVRNQGIDRILVWSPNQTNINALEFPKHISYLTENPGMLRIGCDIP